MRAIFLRGRGMNGLMLNAQAEPVHVQHRQATERARDKRRASILTTILVVAWLLIVAGTFFSYVYIANPGLTFPGALTTNYSSHQIRPATVTLTSCCAQRQQTFFRHFY